MPIATLDVGRMVMGLLGGLSLFLFGMGLMTEAVKVVAGSGLRKLLAQATENRFRAAFTGAAVTAVIQSSSVTTVLLVGFISAGLISLSQSVGVILGANIGSTVTAQIIALDVTRYALAMIAAGYFVQLIVKREVVSRYGNVLLGLGLLFFGMEMMSLATEPLRTYEPFIEVMRELQNPLYEIILGTLFTALVQSSAATTGIVIVLASQGLMPLETGIAIALGANIGTCATAGLAAIGKPREAVRAAVVHALFNVAGVIVWVGFIPELADIVRAVSPESPALGGTMKLAAETPRQIANAHTIFNVANTLLFIWFTGPIARLATFLVPARAIREDPESSPLYLDPVQLTTPDLAIGSIHREITRLGRLVRRMLDRALPAALSGGRKEMEELTELERKVDALYDPILEFIRRLARAGLSDEQTRSLAGYLSIVNHMENLGDAVDTSLIHVGKERLQQHVEVSAATRKELEALQSTVISAYDLVLEALADWDPEAAGRVVAMKNDVKRLSAAAKDQLVDRLTADDPNRLRTFRVESDLVEYLKHLYYFTRRIGKVITGQKEKERESLGLPPRGEG